MLQIQQIFQFTKYFRSVSIQLQMQNRNYSFNKEKQQLSLNQGIDNQLDNELKRILNPSQSTKQLLQTQYQSKIQSIQESLTSRSNFLQMFQQMLEEQIRKNSQSSKQTIEDVINDQKQEQVRQCFTERINITQSQNRQQFNLYTHRTFSRANVIASEKEIKDHVEKQHKIEQTNFKNQEVNIKPPNETNMRDFQESSSGLKSSQEASLYKPRQLNKTEILREKKTFNIQLHRQFSQQQQSSNIQNLTKQNKVCDTLFSDIQSISPDEKSKFIEKLSNLKLMTENMKTQNKKLKYFITYTFNFLKSFLLEEIFKNGLKNIVQNIQRSFEAKYQEKIEQITKQFQQRYCKTRLKSEKQHKDIRQNINDDSIGSISQIKMSDAQIISFRPQCQIQSKNLPSYNSSINSRLSSDEQIKQNRQFANIVLNNYDLKCKQRFSKILKEKTINSTKLQVLDNKLDPNQFHLEKKQSQEGKDLIKSGFLIEIPSELPSIYFPNNQSSLPIKNFPQTPSNQIKFISFETDKFSYQGYIQANKFNGQGILVLKNVNMSYEGQFRNHKMNGKGKLTLLSKPNQLILTVIGKFISNKIESYAKILISNKNRSKKILLKKNYFPANQMQQNSMKENYKQLQQIYAMFKNSRVDKIL